MMTSRMTLLHNSSCRLDDFGATNRAQRGMRDRENEEVTQCMRCNIFLMSLLRHVISSYDACHKLRFRSFADHLLQMLFRPFVILTENTKFTSSIGEDAGAARKFDQLRDDLICMSGTRPLIDRTPRTLGSRDPLKLLTCECLTQDLGKQIIT